MTDDFPEKELDTDDLVNNRSVVIQTNREGHLNVASDVSSLMEVRISHKIPRRELRWKLNKSTNNRSLGSIFEDSLHCISASSADSPLCRITASFHKRGSHRCPGYLREKITLMVDVSRSNIAAHHYPSQNKICTTRGQLVQYPRNTVPHYTTKRRRQPPPKVNIPELSIRIYVPHPFSAWQGEFDYLRIQYSHVPDHFRLFLVAADPALVPMPPPEEPILHVSRNPVPHHTTKRRRQPPPEVNIPEASIKSYVPHPFSAWQGEFDYLRSQYSYVPDHFRLPLVAPDPALVSMPPSREPILHVSRNPVPHYTTKRRRQPPPKVNIPAPSIRSYAPQPFSAWQREFCYLQS